MLTHQSMSMKVNVKAMFVCNMHSSPLSSEEREREREGENKQRYDKHTHINLELITVGDVHTCIFSPFFSVSRRTYKVVLVMTITLDNEKKQHVLYL